MSKRAFTEETYASRTQASNPAHASIPEDVALQLQSLGSRVRKHVTEGYATHRHLSAPPSPTQTSVRTRIFTSANDILRDVYASALPRPSISPRKRPREDDSDHESEDTKMDECNDETAITVNKPVKPKPRRPLMQTQSLPSDIFVGAAETPEDDWSVNNAAFEPVSCL
ncbi:hypothetical protein GGX14DRAFT_614317 [Mycena pura]|uniref:Uncharacterized protein n=1 Tax=Mycena pura TaxID=153505 RepID=A0AAD6YTF6_9AGAR|nr:hypothetical protein GGX14DRAFT_614317 [Mycena pura]